jgi:RNA polymerase sigma factor (sigma-70 family)
MTAIEFNHKVLSLKESLMYFAYSLTANKEDAEDLLQDTYLKAISNKDKFDPASNLKAWVYTIMKNTFINNYRKEVRTNAVVDTTEDLYYLNNTKRSDLVSPESEITHAEIIKGIESLENEHRVPFEMHVQGFKYKEIADELNLSLGTVKSRIFFSRKKLMAKLQDIQN